MSLLNIPLQAQRITVPGRRADGSNSEYIGLWHVDGHWEHVAAVVLYYYHVDPQLVGGDMEFCGREPIAELGIGDGGNFTEFHRGSLRAGLRGEKAPSCECVTKLANCKVPIREGTLLVFSNCQLAHRVLRMVNQGTVEASRDFVALFVLDPAFGPLRPARSVLSAGYDIVRALQHRGVSIQRCPEAVGLVLEFLHLRPSEARRKLMRIDRLREQLQPSGEFCGSSQVVHAGNACFTMIGWLHNMLDKGGLEIFDKAPHWIGKKLLKGLDLPPKQLGRGMSEILSLGTKELENRLKEQEHQLHEVEHQLQEVEDDRHGMKSLKLVVPQRFHCRLLSLKKACPTVELQIPKACVGSDGATALKVIGVGVKEDAEKNLAAHLPAKHVVKVEDEWVCCHCRGLKKSDFHGKGVINAQHVKDKHLSVGQKVTVLDASGHGSVTVLKKAIRSERNNQIGFLDDGTQVEIMGHWLECRWAIRPSHGYSPSQLGFIPAQSIEKDEHVSLQGPVKECFAALAMFQEELGMEIDAFSLGGEPVKLQPQPRRKPKLKK